MSADVERLDSGALSGSLGALLGNRRFWARALSAQTRQPLAVPPVPAPPAMARSRPARVPALVDPLGIEVVGPAPVIRPQPGAGCDYDTVGSIAELREYLRPALQDRQPFGADWETTHLNPALAHPVGLSVSMTNTSARYVPVAHMLSPGANLPEAEVRQVLKDLDAAKAESLWYNAGYDVEVQYRRWDWEPQHWHDVQIAVFLVNSNVIELNLKTTALRFLGRKMQTLEELDEEWITLSKAARKGRSPKLPHQLPVEKVAPYGCDDACCTRAIWFHKDVQQAITEQAWIFQLEERLVPVMREGNRHGVYLDVAQLERLQAECVAQLDRLRPQLLAQLGGTPFKLSQRAVLGERLLAINAVGYVDQNPKSPSHGKWVVERTSQGHVTTNKKILDKYRRQHAIIPQLIEYNELEAQERNYLRKLIKAAKHFATQSWADGRCRFAFNAIGVPTGRMKCGGAGKGGEAYLKGVVDVNAQSLPDHEKAPYLPNTRSGIVAPPGFVIVAGDYSQIELRIPANLAKEPVWIDAFLTGKDIHVQNAQVIANVREPGIHVTKDDKMRRGKAKTTSFALLYGGDERTVARNAGIPEAEAKQILDAFFSGLPCLASWVRTMHQSARSRKQVATFLGRIRHLEQFFLPEPSRRDFRAWKAWKRLDERGCREAINDPIQGGAADLFKHACWRLQQAITAQGWGPEIISPQVFWVHDEVVFYVKAEWVTTVIPVLRAAMEFPVRDWVVPLKAEFEVSSRVLYAEAKQTAALQAGDADKAQHWGDYAQGPEHCNYGELVDLDTWLARYGDTQRAKAVAA
jgi:DNA polymerase I